MLILVYKLIYLKISLVRRLMKTKEVRKKQKLEDLCTNSMLTM